MCLKTNKRQANITFQTIRETTKKNPVKAWDISVECTGMNHLWCSCGHWGLSAFPIPDLPPPHPYDTAGADETPACISVTATHPTFRSLDTYGDCGYSFSSSSRWSLDFPLGCPHDTQHVKCCQDYLSIKPCPFHLNLLIAGRPPAPGTCCIFCC